MLTARAIRKVYPGTIALDGVDFDLASGEIGALMGENGAGKSTLIRILTGVERPDAGEISIDSRPVEFDSPRAAEKFGVAVVHQELELIPHLSIAENISLGRETKRFGLISRRDMRRRAAAALGRLGIEIDLGADLDRESTAVRQMVAIARATEIDAKILILDEPTASLDREERTRLFRILKKLRDDGMAILFVTHFLDEVYEIANRVTILRNGRNVESRPIDRWPKKELVGAMLGRDVTLSAAKMTDVAEGKSPSETPLLVARGLGRDVALESFDGELFPGRITGLAGLLGSGRTEAARLLFGADRSDRGTLEIYGRVVTHQSPRRAIGLGMAFSSENRKSEGIVPDLSIRENITLALQARRGCLSKLRKDVVDDLTLGLMNALKIKAPGPEALVRTLSGGNQQKVVLARFLALEPRIFILDEPTRGIDVGAKFEVAELIAKLAKDGAAVLFISSDIEEVVGLADRIIVMRDRRFVETLDADDISIEDVMSAIAGAANA